MSAPAAAPTPAVRVVTVLAVLLVAAVAAVVSFAHMQELAYQAGEEWRSWLLPLSVDGLVVASSMVLLTRSRAGLPGGWLPWTALLGAVGASLAANVAAAEPTATARVVAAWPALAFAVAFELLLQQRRPVDDGTSLMADRPDETADGGEQKPEPSGIYSPTPDPLVARAAELVAAARAGGRPAGRRTIARQLGVSEHQATQLLARTNGSAS